MQDIYLTNSLTKKKEKFDPMNPPGVGMYTCGMTVYDYAHIGHGRKYVGDDIIKRVLTFNGYDVNHVQNVTDVGHLVSDADEGEDKLEKGARKFGKTVWEVAEFFTKQFYDSMQKLNVVEPDVICKATEHIREQIDLVKSLEDKGFAYETDDAVYFDISKFEKYEQIFGQKLSEKQTAVRDEVKKSENKRNPQDFALWVKRVGEHKDHAMHWDSPWGDGFPGWHIECSAMSMKYLGDQFDIHTGGIDHLSIHHPNEIAQAEGSTGKEPFVKYWIHHNFLLVDGKKMSKSLENLFTVEDVENKGFDPLALRYLYLTAKYNDPLNFTWEALEASGKALNKLRKQMDFLRSESSRTVLSDEKRKKTESFSERFVEAINDDFNTPKALAVLWEALKSNTPSEDKYDLAMTFDEVFGLELSKAQPSIQIEIRLERSNKRALIPKQTPQEMIDKLDHREIARKEEDFSNADLIRKDIEESGYKLKDGESGPILTIDRHENKSADI